MDNKNTNNETPFEVKAKEKSQKKERAVVTASAVFIMAALTLTGIYMNKQSEEEKKILEDSTGLDSDLSGDMLEVPGIEGVGDLQIVDSGTVENPGRTGNAGSSESAQQGENAEDTAENSKKPATKTSNALTTENAGESTELDSEAAMSGMVESMMLSFNGIQMFAPMTEAEEVLIPYSMDKAVYFETLDQYKYSPAIVVSAEVDAPVCAVSAGRIVDKYWDYETGWTLEMDLGGGFTAYYGQLNNDTLEKEVDTYVVAGDVLGYIDTPTKYYAEEGSNMYFAMTRDGQPVDPMDYIGE